MGLSAYTKTVQRIILKELDKLSKAGEKHVFDINHFMRTDRGMALSFWAINEAVGQSVFMVDKDEFSRGGKSLRYRPKKIFDCHTHFNRAASTGTHAANGFRNATNTASFWAMPDLYFMSPFDRGETQNALRHNRDFRFKKYVRDIYFDGDVTAAIITTDTRITDDVLNKEDLENTSRIINLAFNPQSSTGLDNACYHMGYFDNKSAELMGECNTIHAWKIYPAPTFNEWYLKRDNEIAVEKIANECPKPVCIHIMDEPTPAHHLIDAAENHSHLNFIAYHSGFHMGGLPHDRYLVEQANHHSNIFLEVGMIFGGELIRNPLEARSFIQTVFKAPIGQIMWGTDSLWYGSPRWQSEGLARLIVPDMDQEEAEARKEAMFWSNPVRIFAPNQNQHPNQNLTDRNVEYNSLKTRVEQDLYFETWYDQNILSQNTPIP